MRHYGRQWKREEYLKSKPTNMDTAIQDSIDNSPKDDEEIDFESLL